MLDIIPIRETWAILVVAIVPVLGASVAAAEPWEAPDPEASIAVPTETRTAPGDQGTEAHIVSDTAMGSVASPPDDTTPPPPANHGGIVSQVKDLPDLDHRGCVTRQVAQSDLGKKNASGDSNGPSLDGNGRLDPDSIDLDCSGEPSQLNDTNREGVDSDPADDAPPSGKGNQSKGKKKDSKDGK